MHDEMAKDIADQNAAEQAAIRAYDELIAAKTKEVNALTKALEDKIGDGHLLSATDTDFLHRPTQATVWSSAGHTLLPC